MHQDFIVQNELLFKKKISEEIAAFFFSLDGVKIRHFSLGGGGGYGAHNSSGGM